MPDAFFHTPARSYIAVARPNFPTCETRMSLARISERPAGFELRTFECSNADTFLGSWSRPTELSGASGACAEAARRMWRALLTDGLPPCLPAMMSFERVAMSCLVTSLAIFLPSRGPRKLRKWRAYCSHHSIRGRISPSALRTFIFIQPIRSSTISATVLPRAVWTALVWLSCSTSAAGDIALSA
jgi:hypothetical protein